MITKEKARQLALEKIKTSASELDLVIIDQETIEEDFGWVFFYDSKKHWETDDFKYAVAGNAPIIVDRRDGSLHVTGTARPIQDYIAEYKRTSARPKYDTLESIRIELSGLFDHVSLKGQGSASFLYVTNNGRSVEISEHDGCWWLEFWEADEDQNTDLIKDLTTEASEEAVQKTIEWLQSRTM